MKRILFSLILGLIFLGPPALFAQTEDGGVILRGEIRNGTTGRPQRVDELRLIRLKDGMQVLQVVADAGPDFQFDRAPGDAPLLIRASYGGTAYTKMIPPAPRFQKQSQELLVFEPGAERKEITITPLYQFLNAPDGLRVSKVYAIENNSKPPRSFNGGPPIYLPPGAEEVRTQLRNPGSRMPIPIELQKDGEFLRSDRGFRPGRSLLYVDFTVKTRDFVDRVPAAREEGASSPFAVVLWRPEAAKPEITGGETKLIDIPDEGPAYQLQFPATGEVRFRTDDRNFFFENPMAAHENAFLNSPVRTAIAVILALGTFFFLISLLSTLLRGPRTRHE